MIDPPRIALWLFERSLSCHEREAVIGDVIEEFNHRAAVNVSSARRWIWAEACRSAPHNLGRRLRDPRGATDAFPRMEPVCSMASSPICGSRLVC